MNSKEFAGALVFVKNSKGVAMGKPMRQVLDDISRAHKSVEDCMDEGRERSLVLTKLDEARLWAIEYCIANPKKEERNVYIFQ